MPVPSRSAYSGTYISGKQNLKSGLIGNDEDKRGRYPGRGRAALRVVRVSNYPWHLEIKTRIRCK